MKNPWKDNDGAYCDMFDEQVEVEAHDGKRTTMDCAVFTDGTGDPFSDDMLDTDREDITLVFAKKDWPFVQRLRRVDTIRRPDFNGLSYSVQEAKLDNCLGWCVKARSLKKGA